MKYIVSTTNSPIKFNLDGDHSFLFDTLSPTEVTDIQFELLRKRLGVQIKEVPQSQPLSTPANPDIVNEEDFLSIVKTPVVKPLPVDTISDEKVGQIIS